MSIKAAIIEKYPYQFEEKLLDEMESVGKLLTFKAQDTLINIGQRLTSMPLLLDGAIKVMREDYDDGELLLYFLEKGDTCVMTMACCMGDKESKIRAIGEKNGHIVMLPVTMLDEWMAKYPSWRAFVFQSYNNRFDEMLIAIDNLAFNDMGARIKKYLLDVATINHGNVVNKTHQEIANELNTSRVVVSRLLKALENEGFLKINRNQISIN